MNIIVCKDAQAVDAFVAERLISLIQKKPDAVIGFATGDTPLGTYSYLIDAYRQGRISFRNVSAFNLDEYAGIPKSHPRSFATAMKQALFDHIDIPVEQIHALDGAAVDLMKECKRYDEDIAQHPIDIQLLGIGMDGHIAYNEPGSSFSSNCHVVDLHQESIESSLNYGFTKIEDVPTQGITQGIHTIMQAHQLLMIAKGKKKATLVQRMCCGEISEAFPSSIIQRHPNTLIVLDEEAASCLEEDCYERS